jgi:trimeric autotransporter adhesin
MNPEKTMKSKIQNTLPAALVLMLVTVLNLQLSTAFAQGTAFTYQGRLNDNGSPANGTYDLRFKLFGDPLGNNQIGSAVLTNGVPLTNGLFAVTVDFGAGIFNGSSYWLEVDARTNGAVGYVNLNPLQALTPAPYAIFANTASNVNGTISSSSLSGIYTAPVTFSNGGNSFSGNGSGLSGLNASQLTSGTVPAAALANAWKISGNSGTSPGANFVGTTDNQPLELRVNGGRALRLEPTATNGAVNVIGGSPINFVSNGVVGATIAGGGAVSYAGSSPSNSVMGDFGSVGGGDGNRAAGYEATISGGGANIISNDDATVGGGFFNAAGGYAATVGGGFQNVAGGDMATVGGGLGNNSTAEYATVAGGSGNYATGLAATVPGGYQDIAAGPYSLAAGNQAYAGHSGAFVWADSQNATYYSDRADQFKIRAAGGVVLDVSGSSGLSPAALRINSTSANGVGIFVAQTSSDATAVFTAAGTGDIIKGYSGATGGNLVFEVTNNGTVYSKGLALTSDRNAKDNFTALDSQAILAKVARLPVTEWNYKDDGADQKHIGPMAQDFHAAFGLNGADDKHISVVDEGGVALAAIQGLNQKLDASTVNSDVRIQKLEAENTVLKRRLEALEKVILKQNQTKGAQQ